MKIGIIEYLSEKKDEAYAVIISNKNYNDMINFKPSKLNFQPRLSQLIVIENDNSEYHKFNSDKHKELLNLEKLRESNRSINIMSNLHEAKFIILNNLYRENKTLNKIEYIRNNIEMGMLMTPKKFRLKKDICQLIEEYSIEYNEHGYNKRGDWSRASISITTNRPIIFHEYENDPYLDKLFPNISFDLGKGEDSVEFPFANDILSNLRKELDVKNIKKECEHLTHHIKQLAKFIYDEQKHAAALYDYCQRKKWEIIRNYEKLAIH